LSNAYGDASATAPKFVAIRQNLEVTSTAKKADLEAKLAALRGTTGFNGTIHTAYVAKEAARTALEASVASLRVMFLDLSRGTDVAAIAELLARDTNSPAIATAKALVQANLDAFKAADKAFTDIVAELAKIAVYNAAGNVVGGELAAVNANLNPAALDAAARSEATKIARFFAEINKEIGDNNQVVLFNQLHAVI
jgi:hypothetical protein